MRSTLHALPSLLFASAVLAAAVPAFAADPTTADCLGANERALTLRSGHKLRDSRAQFLVCSSASCPADVRTECQRRVSEVSTAIPTVVFEAKDETGNDLTAVKVTMDGLPLAERLEGIAISLDPGAHQFTFETAGRPTLEKTIVINEGEKDRREIIVLPKAPEAAPPVVAPAPAPPEPAPVQAAPQAPEPPPATPPEPATTPATPPEQTSYWTGTRTLGVVLTGAGVVGLGIGGILGLVAKGQYSTAADESGSARVNDSGSAVSTGNTATAVVAVSGVLAAVGVIVWIAAPSPKASVGVSGNQLVLRGTF